MVVLVFTSLSLSLCLCLSMYIYIYIYMILIFTNIFFLSLIVSAYIDDWLLSFSPVLSESRVLFSRVTLDT